MTNLFKRGFLYSIVGLLVVGGVSVWSVENAYAVEYGTWIPTKITGEPTVANFGPLDPSYCPLSVSYLGDILIYNDTYTTSYGSATNQAGCGTFNLLVTLAVAPDGWYHYAVRHVGDLVKLVHGDVYKSGTTYTVSNPPESYYETRFISITPYYGEATSTGMVTSSIYGYINAVDLANAGGTMSLTSVAYRENPLVKIPHAVQVDISSSGFFYAYGTTTIDSPSIYSESWVLSDEDQTVPWWKFVLNFLRRAEVTTPDLKIYLSTSTLFSVGTLSPAQQALFQQKISRENRQSSTTAAYDLTSCGLFSSNFSMEDCIYSLVIPSSDAMKSLSDDAQSGFLTAAPWGYAMRIINLINASSSTSTLPIISYTFPSSFPGFGNMNFHFDPYAYMVQAKTLVNDEMVSNTGSGKNVWEIFGGLVNTIIVLVLIFKMLEDIMGLNLSFGGREKEREEVMQT